MSDYFRSETEVKIRVTVPEEFTGMAIEELNRLEGLLTEMTVGESLVAIDAELPIKAFEAYVSFISLSTNGRGNAIIV